MPDNDTPARGRWFQRRRGWRLAAVGLAAIFVVGLATPVGALLPFDADQVWSPADYWSPEPEPAPPPEPAPVEPAPTPPEPAPSEPTSPPAQNPGGSPDNPAPPATGATGTTPAEQALTPQQQADARVNKAIADARTALANPGCRDFVGRGPGNETALQVLDAIANSVNNPGQKQLYNFYNLAKQTSDGREVYAETNTVGSAAGGTLYFYKAFHDSTLPTSYYNPPTSPDNKMYELDADQARTMVVLHELMHLLGTLTDSHTTTDALGNTDSDLGDIQDIIITNCIPNARRVARPAARPGGGDGGGAPNDGPVVANPYPPSGGGPGDLPESDYPVIDFGSDCPVIRGEDGSIIEGGDCGPGESELPELGDCCDEVPSDPDPGEPYDPGYGGGGGGGGGSPDCWYDFEWDWLACEVGYYVY